MSESDFVVAVEDAGPARKHVKITLPAEKVSSRLGDALGDLAANATIPGFRRGHAPAKLLENASAVNFARKPEIDSSKRDSKRPSAVMGCDLSVIPCPWVPWQT